MQHLKVSGAVWPLKWSLGVKWLTKKYLLVTCRCCVSDMNKQIGTSLNTKISLLDN